MKYVAEMDSGAVINMPVFIKISLAVQKFITVDSQTRIQQGDRLNFLLFFKNKEGRLIRGAGH
jgi:hypothetical protein